MESVRQSLGKKLEGLRSVDMKSVLMIVHMFPPFGGTGAIRAIKFAKYLPSYGWKPIILTVRKHVVHYKDESLLLQLPAQVEINRTFSLEEIITPSLWGSPSAVKANEDSFHNTSTSASKIRDVMRLIKRKISFPEEHIYWFPSAVIKGLKLIRDQEIKVIYSTSPPFTDHIIGACLKGLSRSPLVVDFRDPWAHLPIRIRERGTFRRYAEERLEFSILKSADKILAVTETMISDFRDKYPSINKSKYELITNGFDPDDYPSYVPPRTDNMIHTNSEKPLSRNDKIQITYTGTFCIEHSPVSFLRAVKELIENNPEFKDVIKVNFIGYVEERFKDYILELGDIVDVKGTVSYEEAIRYQLEADILLLIIEPGYALTNKLFEYLATGKPILAITQKDGEAERLLNRLGVGITVDPDDVNGIKEELLKLLRSLNKGGDDKGVIPEVEELFSRKKLAGQLAEVLDKLVR